MFTSEQNPRRPSCIYPAMKDMRTHLEKLLIDAEECALISKLATDMQKRDLFARLAAHLRVLAEEIERAILAQKASEPAAAGTGATGKTPGDMLVGKASSPIR